MRVKMCLVLVLSLLAAHIAASSVATKPLDDFLSAVSLSSEADEVCRDLVGMIHHHTGENVQSLCARNLFLAICLPSSHHEGGGAFNRKFTANANINGYGDLEGRVDEYLRLKRTVDALAAGNYLLSTCAEHLERIHDKALEEVIQESFTHEEDFEGRQDVWKPSHTQLSALQSYLNGTGMIFYLHITHNAGTTLLGIAAENSLQMPATTGKIWNPGCRDSYSSSVCNTGGKDGLEIAADYLKSELDFVSVEHVLPVPGPFDTIFTSPRITYVTTMRHPIGRILSGDGTSGFPEKKYSPPDYSRWAYTKQANNYLIRCLIGGFGKGVLSRHDLEVAKDRLREFSVILIVEWLPQSYQLLCVVLQWQQCTMPPAKKGHHPPSRERIGNDTVVSFLRERNHLDIELYQYAVELNLRQMRAAGVELPNLEKYTH